MFYTRSNEGFREALPGIRIKTITWGARTLTAEFRMTAGASLPRHAHVHEQAGFLVSGHIRLAIGDATYDVHPGDAWAIRGDVEHAAEILEDTIAVEVFSPVREDYLPENP
ncbi:MAG: cupin domain-containing protein [Candidatus Hydrogenedentes bacterium]|jgi:quercetin dioxygenase-like cupin family protein|nr:cupin domain-containing protein [Candidatus Hydrogenedentota bacterium]NLT59339.1 cupin domain-containing protein [Candidatus Hydrogenedentota bacterium]HNZ20080.1 cupin domain-containing protein [Candidatus Hydrogenedentota bacterium]HOH35521.1 cupin domain-containing protein [Candidatus Hydrogenedentota bacterium]HPV38698.1 cupin domain-containing protein [Candidatus Hydrogenedentota bacterium]